jgi:putative ABC transport system substrate-binding protein
MRPVRRRAIVSAIVAAALGPRALAQPRPRVVGYLSNGAEASIFTKPLAEHGFKEGANLRFEMRVAPADSSRLAAVATELVRFAPDVLVAFGASNIDALAKATRKIPIVCGGTADPVGTGYAKSLARPGGNITGLSYGVPEMSEILIGMMRAVRPGLRRIAAMVRAREGQGVGQWNRILRPLEAAAREVGATLAFSPVGSLADIEKVLDALDPRVAVAYFINLPDAAMFGPSALAATRRGIVSITTIEDQVRAGALLHYSMFHEEPTRKVAAIVARLLRGAKAADTPFELPDRTACVVNRATAKALRIELPSAILVRATEVVG